MKAVEAITATGRVAQDFKFCDQLNDAALDAAADVAEGFARFYPKEFARFLDFAIASLAEVRTRMEAGYRRKYFTAATTSDVLQLCIRADKAARSLRKYLWSVKKEDLPPRPNCDAAARLAKELASRRGAPRPGRTHAVNRSDDRSEGNVNSAVRGPGDANLREPS